MKYVIHYVIIEFLGNIERLKIVLFILFNEH